ncbi:hemerythrin domain-containing protein [Myxococcota bacterium]|nr:hemerythrin domain-containing protein [Myxococcota bacterium]
MQLLDDLANEHLLIEQVVGALETYALRTQTGHALPADGPAFLAFFRLYAGHFHHAKEEQVLFPALVSTEVPADRGPLAVLLHAHHVMGKMLDDVAPLLAGQPLDGPDRERLLARSRRYGAALLEHIDAERSVLFPESEIRFRTAAITALDARGPDEAETRARVDGERLVQDYPPSDLPGVFRGEGCVACSHYGTSCDGIEREWWSEHEWEDTLERMGNG